MASPNKVSGYIGLMLLAFTAILVALGGDDVLAQACLFVLMGMPQERSLSSSGAEGPRREETGFTLAGVGCRSRWLEFRYSFEYGS